MSAAEVEALRSWIAGGAIWPRTRRGTEKLATAAVAQTGSSEAGCSLGADAGGCLLCWQKSLPEKGLTPSADADRRILIRRLTYDLHGLPPTWEEIRMFESDQSTNAYEKLVDRLLASPRYGERWGCHWLDVVHYGESHGYDKDKTFLNAWPYRDYVIRSFNEDKPYARFVKEQLAGSVVSGRSAGHRSDWLHRGGSVGFCRARGIARRYRTRKSRACWIGRYGDVDHVRFREHDGALRTLPQSQV